MADATHIPARRRSGLGVAAATVAALLLPAAPAAAEEPQGPIVAELKLGPAIGIADFKDYTAFALELSGGYEVFEHGYVTFSPSFALGDLTLITLPGGFEYDYPLPVDGLSAYGRATLGVGFFTQGGDPAFHIGPHLGAKYQITPMFHAGLEPLGLPMYFGNGGTGVHLRILAFAGGDF